jgi:hypothetical protein
MKAGGTSKDQNDHTPNENNQTSHIVQSPFSTTVLAVTGGFIHK